METFVVGTYVWRPDGDLPALLDVIPDEPTEVELWSYGDVVRAVLLPVDDEADVWRGENLVLSALPGDDGFELLGNLATDTAVRPYRFDDQPFPD